jgi:protein involved in polysaccharide export with SLBB domain
MDPKEEEQRRKAEAALEKMIDAYDLQPHPLPAIPDNPPPHEGAMINYPLVIEPPDLVLIEVLEALPGRPISGERLVRPDGMINLSFYGNVHIAGLTPEQAKVKIIKHLRKHLSDEILGLYEIEEEESAMEPVPAPPPAKADPFEPDQQQAPKPKAKKTSGAASRIRTIRRPQEGPSAIGRSRSGARVRFSAMREGQDEKKVDEPQKPVRIPVPAGGQVTITIEAQSKDKQEESPFANGAPPTRGETIIGPPVPPDQSDRVFVDITAYNSKNYFVMGDVAIPGKLPITGLETVLDALQYAGGLLPTAESKDIRLVRPARAGKPARVYMVDLQAINERGDVTSNYQMFPGDRLIVGRNDVVKKNIELDRLSAILSTVSAAIQRDANMLRVVQATGPEMKDAMLKDEVEFWVQELNRPGGAKFDEQTLRDALLRRLQIKP